MSQAQRDPLQVYWLSGLTCTDENFSQKAGAFQAACDNQARLRKPQRVHDSEGCDLYGLDVYRKVLAVLRVHTYHIFAYYVTHLYNWRHNTVASMLCNVVSLRYDT